MQNPLVSIVDDDPSVLSSTRRLVRSFGYRAEAFGSAREFLLSGHSADTACLILDLSISEVDGLQFQRCINNDRTRIPIVFMTGNPSNKDRTSTAHAGVISVLRKPVGAERLVAAIQAALRRYFEGHQPPRIESPARQLHRPFEQKLL